MLLDELKGRELNERILELFPLWTPNMLVSVRGRGKATRTDRKGCPDGTNAGESKYPGDCDNCAFFMGAKVTGNSVPWDTEFPACCGLALDIQLKKELEGV